VQIRLRTARIRVRSRRVACNDPARVSDSTA